MEPWRELFGPSTASNNWVVHGNRTTTGLSVDLLTLLRCLLTHLLLYHSGFPFLCNDPHLQLMAPSIWLCKSVVKPFQLAPNAVCRSVALALTHD